MHWGETYLHSMYSLRMRYTYTLNHSNVVIDSTGSTLSLASGTDIFLLVRISFHAGTRPTYVGAHSFLSGCNMSEYGRRSS